MVLGKLIQNINRTNNFIYLTLSLLTLLIASSFAPLLHEKAMEYIIQSIILLTFIVCFASLQFDRKWTVFLSVLAIFAVTVIAIKHIFHIEELSMVMLALTFVFFFGTFKSSAKQIFNTGPVDTNKLVGSVALFLLLGLMWTIAYLILLDIDPTSFNGLDALSYEENFSDSAYFSFVTLTTLGYGDISPATRIAKTLVYLESIVGVFYIAVVVSSLVSSNLEQKNHRADQ